MTSEPIPAGFVLVPVEPTEAMVAAAFQKIDWARSEQYQRHPLDRELRDGSGDDGGTTPAEDVRDAWSAMLAAAPTSDSAPAGDTARAAPAEVAQADREAAAAIYRKMGQPLSHLAVATGLADDNPIVLAFARHRASSEAVEQSEVSRLREALEPFAIVAASVLGEERRKDRHDDRPWVSRLDRTMITYGDLRRAVAALNGGAS